jgi:hypothetical protein
MMALMSLIFAHKSSAQYWRITVVDLQLAQTIDVNNIVVRNPVAEPENIFVRVTIKVMNSGKESGDFYPDEIMKLLIHGATIDAATIWTHRTSDRIEPFTSQIREFYFEIPRSFEGESAALVLGKRTDRPVAFPIVIPSYVKDPLSASDPRN